MSAQNIARKLLIVAWAAAALLMTSGPALAQRLLGIDVSAWQGNLSTSNWTTLHTTNDRDFVLIRSTRGGTTGFDHYQTDSLLTSPADCNGVSTTECLSNRYDDPYFGQNITRATNAGLFAGTYQRSQMQIIATTPNSGGIANTGTDEANHMIQMAGAWMRPGYLPPVLDFEDGAAERSGSESAQFALDFSNRIYAVMGIRPVIYFNGVYATELNGGTSSQFSQLAQQSSNPPSVVSPAFPTLWIARWPNQADPNSIDVQNSNPKDAGAGVSYIYGPWDNYGVTQPWQFWQYASTARLSGYANGTLNIDVDVTQGDIESLKDNLVPALWWNDTSGDWSTFGNWNSGRSLNTYNTSLTFDQQPSPAPYIPPVFPNMSPVQGSTTLPSPRLPGAAGSGPTAGSNDTVILERPNANITVTLSTGTHNIRKLYMREALNVTGGSLTINYDPDYFSDTVTYPNALRSGPISAQFSGAVSLSGTGSLSVNTLQVDTTRTFTLAGSTGTLTFKTINLMPHSTTPAKIAVTGDVNINPLNNATATIANGSGSGNTGFVDLSGGAPIFTIGNGTSDVDLDVAVPITNGGLSKAGAGTMRLSGNNTFFGAVTVKAGVLRYGHSSGLTSSTAVAVNNGGTLDMNGISDTIASLASAAGNTTGVVMQGTAGLTLAAASGGNSFGGTITGSGTFTKNGAATQILSGNNSLGPVAVNAGSLLFNGTNTTGNVTVSGGALGGTGSVSGAVTVNSTGHLAPGASIESLGVGALTLNAGSVLDFELGAPSVSDLIDVSGLLTLNGGSLNLTNAGGLTIGTYTLIDYGTLSGSLGALGVPIAPGNLKYSLTDTGSVINLLVTMLGDFNNDGIANNADYVVWRNGLGTIYMQSDYNAWRAHFGETASSGSGVGAGAAVPEPATAALLLCGLLPFCCGRRLRRQAKATAELS
ncbi:MAG: GH25 family lysozyme [Pirellulales bacterium]